MNNAVLRKLDAYTQALRTSLVRAYSHYLFLRPMLGSREVIVQWSTRDRQRGFAQLRDTLYWNLVQEIFKLVHDDDQRVPSIRNISTILKNPDIRPLLRQAHAECFLPKVKKGQPVREDIKAMYSRSDAECDDISARIDEASSRLLSSETVRSYASIRHKLIAHNELRHNATEYEFYDISGLGLKYGDEAGILAQARDIFDDINTAVRHAAYDWDHLFRMEVKVACGFWGIEPEQHPFVQSGGLSVDAHRIF